MGKLHALARFALRHKHRLLTDIRQSAMHDAIYLARALSIDCVHLKAPRTRPVPESCYVH